MRGRTKYRSDKSEGPTASTETVDPLEFLARVLVHIPDQGHVMTRYYGWYANRPRGMRDKAAPAMQLFEGDPVACPACHGVMRLVAFITQASVIHQPTRSESPIRSWCTKRFSPPSRTVSVSMV